MQHERRLSERKTLEQRVYIALPSGNGGIVRDVSEGGLGFQAIAPVAPSGPIPFWFSAMFSSANSNGIEGNCELVWTDESKKTGGLRFTQLSAGVREQIRSWSSESNRRLGSGKDSAPDVPALNESLPSFTTEKTTDPSPTSEASPHPVLGPEVYAYSLRSPKKSYFEEHSRSRLKAISVSVLAIIIAVLSYIYHEAGKAQHTYQIPSPASNLSSEIRPLNDASADKSKTEGATAQAVPQAPSTVTQGIAKANVARTPAPDTSATDNPLRKPLLPRDALIVQVGAFAHEANARKLAESLRQKKFPAFVSITPNEGVFYRVQVGPYADEESARIARSELGSAGFNPFIRH